jgi:hypothetical protein
MNFWLIDLCFIQRCIIHLPMCIVKSKIWCFSLKSASSYWPFQTFGSIQILKMQTKLVMWQWKILNYIDIWIIVQLIIGQIQLTDNFLWNHSWWKHKFTICQTFLNLFLVKKFGTQPMVNFIHYSEITIFIEIGGRCYQLWIFLVVYRTQ